MKIKKIKGFTLIELLVVVSIIAILMGLSFFGLQGARTSSRDGRRKADLESIRSGLEIYRSDCNQYPVSLTTSLSGDDSSSSCLSSNKYIESVPQDPTPTLSSYRYSSNGTTYEICTALEQGSGSVTCGGSNSCGGKTCNYKVVNP